MRVLIHQKRKKEIRRSEHNRIYQKQLINRIVGELTSISSYNDIWVIISKLPSIKKARLDWPCFLFDYYFSNHSFLKMVPTYQFICTGLFRFHGNGFFCSRLNLGVNSELFHCEGMLFRPFVFQYQRCRSSIRNSDDFRIKVIIVQLDLNRFHCLNRLCYDADSANTLSEPGVVTTTIIASKTTMPVNHFFTDIRNPSFPKTIFFQFIKYYHYDFGNSSPLSSIFYKFFYQFYYVTR